MAAAPIPPRALASYVLGGVDDDAWAADYDAVGRTVAAALRPHTPAAALAPGGRLLDFGCGSGRVLRHLPTEDGGELHGCDIHVPSLRWIDAHLPHVTTVVVPARPPLPYPDEHFDAVWAVAVFSQIADGWAEWLLELRRVTRSGGTVAVTLLGAAAAAPVTGQRVADDEIGMRVYGAGRPWAAGGPMIVHGRWWVAEHYGRAFDVLGHHVGVACGQDLVVLRRPPGAGPDAGALRRPAADDPRELAAAHADVQRLLADLADLNRSHDAYAAAYAAEAAKVAALERGAGAPAPPRRRRLRRRPRLR